MKNHVIGVIGLGYVGLPLAVEFGKYCNVVGYDINKSRIESLKNGVDDTLEVTKAEFEQAKYLFLSHNAIELKRCNTYIVTVPTPVDKNNRPDFSPLIDASKLVGEYLNHGDIVIFESTVYPGATDNHFNDRGQSRLCSWFHRVFFCYDYWRTFVFVGS